MADGKVLIIDDDPTILSTYQLAFSAEGYDVETATNGQEGLDKAKQVHPMAIVVDMMMPVMDGKTFLNNLRKDPSFANTPVIVCTALVPEIGKGDVSQTATEYVEKTEVDPLMLIEKIKGYLNAAPTVAAPVTATPPVAQPVPASQPVAPAAPAPAQPIPMPTPTIPAVPVPTTPTAPSPIPTVPTPPAPAPTMPSAPIPPTAPPPPTLPTQQ